MTTSTTTRTELRFTAMGSDAHLIVIGGDLDLAEVGRARIDQLERRWSRFRSDSEVSRLNAHAGLPLVVSDDTVLLVRRAIEAWCITGGAYDPTVLGDVIRAGYDRTFAELPAERRSDHDATPWSVLIPGCTDVRVTGNEVCLPAGTGFDPGGIGKGLAADLVAAELRAAGARSVCVNLGGDVRVSGRPPGRAGWTVGIDVPRVAGPLARVGLADGAVATSTSLLRRWLLDGRPRHHLIDPATGEPTDSDLALASVVAGEAWVAEALAKAVLLRGADHPFDLIDGAGPEALVVTTAGAVLRSPGLAAFLGDRDLPTVVVPTETGDEEAGGTDAAPDGAGGDDRQCEAVLVA